MEKEKNEFICTRHIGFNCGMRNERSYSQECRTCKLPKECPEARCEYMVIAIAPEPVPEPVPEPEVKPAISADKIESEIDRDADAKLDSQLGRF
jgi:hypothetical protein